MQSEGARVTIDSGNDAALTGNDAALTDNAGHEVDKNFAYAKNY